MGIKFCPIASGSSGNCIYVGTKETNILIDAGISGIRISEGLKRINVAPEDIDAVFVTHDHSDHVKGAGIFSRKFKTPVCATEGTWKVMAGLIGKVSEENIRYIQPDTPMRFKDMEILPFRTPHDAEEPVGFSVMSGGVKATVATDIGHLSAGVSEMVKGSDIVLLEANHDIEMLKKGPYPYYLKQRILSDYGHLSNEMAASLLLSAISPRLKHIYLGHLSSENNTPRLAFDTVYQILKENGALNGKYIMRCANRSEVSALAEVSDEY